MPRNIMEGFKESFNFVNKTEWKDDWSFGYYVKFCTLYNNKIKEIDLENLFKSYEAIIKNLKPNMTFEEYVNTWKKGGYRIV